MNHIKLVAILIASATFSTAGVAMAASHNMPAEGHDMKHDGMHHGDMKHDSAKASKMAFDHQFLDTMSMHHSHGIEMAELAQDRAGHDELKQMAKKMIADQQPETKKMQGMKEQWYAGKGDAMNMQMTGMKGSMKEHEKHMAKLKAAKGDQFDSLFLNMMSHHHAGGIKMAQQALKKAEQEEVIELAKNIIEKQKKEIAEMASMKKEWKLPAQKS